MMVQPLLRDPQAGRFGEYYYSVTSLLLLLLLLLL